VAYFSMGDVMTTVVDTPVLAGPVLAGRDVLAVQPQPANQLVASQPQQESPPPQPLPVPQRGRAFILADGFDRIVRSVGALAVGVIGGLELFGPDILSGIAIPTEWSTLMFTGGLGYFGISIRNQEKSP
jgi:hypothetical protein